MCREWKCIKMEAVENLPTTRRVMRLQGFPGFADFIMSNFSSVAAPLIALIKVKVPAASVVTKKLIRPFEESKSVSIFIFPNPLDPFCC